MFCPNNKSVTMYKVQGRALGVMAVIGVMAFIVFLSQIYSTEKSDAVHFWQKSKLISGLRVDDIVKENLTVIKGDDGSGGAENKTGSLYAIVFDAGSTGSRVHVFDFTTRFGEQLKLEEEIFEQVKPGLSSYAADPYKAAQSLTGLLQICLDKVPKDHHRTTPLVLKATAGLRLLQEGVADNILNEVLALLKKYPFQLLSDSVGIMDGVDEGIFSWMTINFMLGALAKGKSPVPALDLGGGSTQLTFVPQSQETTRDIPADFIKNVSLFKSQYRLYTHSYLHLGLMSVRFTMTGGDDLKDKDTEGAILTGPCIQTGYSGDYDYNGKTYKLRGSETKFSYNNCDSQITSFVKPLVKPVRELSDKPVYIFSYFFDRAVEAGLIGSTGGSTKVLEFKNAALKAFSNPDPKFPFAALDLTFIYSLLHNGYEISDTTVVHLEKKIGGVKVSWGLGGAFQLLSDADLLCITLEKKIGGVEVSWGLGAAFQLLSDAGLAR